MAAQTTLHNDGFVFLRRVLQADGLSSGISGAALTFGAGPVGAFLGLETTWVLVLIGILLLVYAAALFYAAAQERIERQFLAAVIALNVAWVIGSGVILLTEWLPLTPGGWWAVAVVADAVAIFAALQYYGLRRL
jgi:hypothetical protein